MRNEFLLDDAKHFLAKRIANTFILEDEGKVVAYCCLLNDKVTRLEIIGSQWKKIKDTFPDGKKFRSYPSVKIGRFAVAKGYQSQHIGGHVQNPVFGRRNTLQETFIDAFGEVDVEHLSQSARALEMIFISA
ncbi:MAG: hypothetical protein KBS72_01575 [Bacteroidales bacterium]|nr:hypothetical protein [Candidatus Cacconaster scatequi]